MPYGAYETPRDWFYQFVAGTSDELYDDKEKRPRSDGEVVEDWCRPLDRADLSKLLHGIEHVLANLESEADEVGQHRYFRNENDVRKWLAELQRHVLNEYLARQS